MIFVVAGYYLLTRGKAQIVLRRHKRIRTKLAPYQADVFSLSIADARIRAEQIISDSSGWKTGPRRGPPDPQVARLGPSLRDLFNHWEEVQTPDDNVSLYFMDEIGGTDSTDFPTSAIGAERFGISSTCDFQGSLMAYAGDEIIHEMPYVSEGTADLRTYPSTGLSRTT